MEEPTCEAFRDFARTASDFRARTVWCAAIDAALALTPGGTICDPQQIADSIRALKETT